MLEGTWDAAAGGRTDHWAVATPGDAEAVVGKLAAAGVDCVKIRTIAHEATYLAVAAAARRHHLPLVGHAPWGVDPIEASNAGQRSFEHGFYPWPWSSLTKDQQRAVATTFRLNSSLVTPTLIAWQPFLLPSRTIQAVIDDTRGTTDPRENTVSAALRRNWRSGFDDIKKARTDTPGSHDAWVKALDGAAAEIRDLHDHGVGVMVGTDTGATLVYPGAAVHQEMKLLVRKVGLRPIDAILGATIIPAKHFGLEGSLGTIEVGKLADLVLLSADPLADIEHIHDIELVILDGRVLDHHRLESLIADAARQIAAP
jgi:imidazolonepropionase-like amidohydrolase